MKARKSHNYPSNREIARPKVIRLHLQGLDAKQIADTLNINPRYCRQIIYEVESDTKLLGFEDYRGLLVQKFHQICDCHQVINRDLFTEYVRMSDRASGVNPDERPAEYDKLVDRRTDIGQKITSNHSRFVDMLAKMGVPAKLNEEQNGSHPQASTDKDYLDYIKNMPEDKLIQEVEASQARIAKWLKENKPQANVLPVKELTGQSMGRSAS